MLRFDTRVCIRLRVVLISGASVGTNAKTVGMSTADRNRVISSNTTLLAGVGLITKLTAVPIEVGTKPVYVSGGCLFTLGLAQCAQS